jgi:hypothetical protein
MLFFTGKFAITVCAKHKRGESSANLAVVQTIVPDGLAASFEDSATDVEYPLPPLCSRMADELVALRSPLGPSHWRIPTCDGHVVVLTEE